MLTESIPIKKTGSLPFRGALLASGVMAFAGIGDALLYPVLPIYGESMGVSAFFIGLLLSVNRFVRILANTPIANYVNRLGMKKVLIVSSITAVLTTVFYGLQPAAIVFLMARIAWGLSYSGLKIATLNYAASAREKSGLAFGMSTSIKTLGVLFALYAGPIFIDSLGIANGFLGVSIVSSVGIVLALMLPTERTITQPKVQTKETFSPNSTNLLVFILSITIDGILVVVLASLLKGAYPDNGSLLVGISFYLLLKRLSILSLSFISGFMTLRISALSLFQVGVIFSALGVLLIGLGFTIYGVTLAFLFNTLVVTFSPLIAIQKGGDRDRSLQAISGVSTWWDLGAAIGAFSGISLVGMVDSQHLFLTLFCLITFLFFNFICQNANRNRATI